MQSGRHEFFTRFANLPHPPAFAIPHSRCMKHQTPDRGRETSRTPHLTKPKPHNKMAKRKYPPVAERIGIFQAAWREIAPEATFAGMTLVEFEAATQPVAGNTDKLQALAAQTSAALREKGEVESAARELLRKVANGVRGNDQYGEDSPLYRAMGFVPLSERRSGLTRGTSAEEAPPADEEAA